MKTIKEKAGYSFSWGAGGKKWTRGRIRYSEGKKWISQNEWIPILAKTNLDTLEVTECSIKEYERFLTPEGYKEFLIERFNQMAEKG